MFISLEPDNEIATSAKFSTALRICGTRHCGSDELVTNYVHIYMTVEGTVWICVNIGLSTAPNVSLSVSNGFIYAPHTFAELSANSF